MLRLAEFLEEVQQVSSETLIRSSEAQAGHGQRQDDAQTHTETFNEMDLTCSTSLPFKGPSYSTVSTSLSVSSAWRTSPVSLHSRIQTQANISRLQSLRAVAQY